MKKIPDAALAQHTIILGKTRAGKSSVARGMVEHMLDDEKPVCIIDPKGDWWGLKSSADGKKPGYPVVIFGGAHADVPINAHAGSHVAELVATGNRPCIIDLGGWMVGERTRFYIDFASTLFRTTRGLRWLVIDECHNFAPQGKIMDPDAGKMLHWSNRLASEGLGKGLQIIAASQRPQKVHKDFVTSCETLIAMRVIHPLDRGAIKEWIDGCPDPAKGREVLADLAQMPRGTGWVWSPEIGFGPAKIAFPLFSTYDSFKPQHGDGVTKLKGWASVDLDEVRAKLGSVVQEAEANDPRRLRARIAELERDARKAPAADPDAIAKAERRGYGMGKIDGYGEGVNAVRGELVALNTAMTMFDNARQSFNSAMNTVEKWRQREPSATPAPHQRQQAPAPTSARAAARRPDLPSPTALSKAERLILTALAQYPDGRAHSQVAILTGYAGNGGGFRNAVSALRSAGRLAGDSNRLVITDNGMTALGPFEPLPHGEALLEHWLRQLSKAESAALRAIVAAYPGSITTEACAATAGYEAGGGGFRNALSRLRTLELIAGRGDLRASESLFG
jgi:hypothetical protein